MEKKIDQNQDCIRIIKANLQEMKSDSDKSDKKYPSEPETRTKKIMLSSCHGKFKEVLTCNQTIQINWKSMVQKNLKETIALINPDLDEE
jgi:hypothetical protein